MITFKVSADSLRVTIPLTPLYAITEADNVYAAVATILGYTSGMGDNTLRVILDKALKDSMYRRERIAAMCEEEKE